MLSAAPEVQLSSYCSSHSDMFSLGMVIFAIFNNGRPLIQANHSSSTYMKQLDVVSCKNVIANNDNNWFEENQLRLQFDIVVKLILNMILQF